MREYLDKSAQLDSLITLADSSNVDDAWVALERLCRTMGFLYSGIGTIVPDDEGPQIALDHATPFFLTSFAAYMRKGLNLRDPAARTLAGGAPYIFADRECNDATSEFFDGGQDVLRHLREYSITGHAAFRIDLPDDYGIGILGMGTTQSINIDDFHRTVEHYADTLRLAGILFVSAVPGGRPSPGDAVLTARERHVLTLVAEGMSPAEIAESENRSLATIRQQLATAKSRLGARNITHAVSIALALNAIRLDR